MFSGVISLVLRDADMDSESVSLIWLCASDGQKTSDDVMTIKFYTSFEFLRKMISQVQFEFECIVFIQYISFQYDWTLPVRVRPFVSLIKSR